MRRVITIMGVCLTFSMPLAAQESTLAGKIWDVSQEAFVAFPDMLKTVSNKPYIIIGERHGRKAHQEREAFLIGALAEAGRYPTIAFEMLNYKQDPIVADYRKKSPEYALGLAIPLKWSDTNWPAWSFYQPVFDVAFTTKARIVGADLTDAEQEQVKTVRPNNARTPTTSLPYYKKTMRAAHCGLINDDKATELAYLQIARDQQMAKTLQERRDAKQGALLIVGSAHIRKSSGIPNYLPPDETAVIIMVETTDNTAAFTQSSRDIVSGNLTDYDYIWFTPKIEKTSLCDRIGKKADPNDN